MVSIRMGIKYYRLPIFICLFVTLTLLKCTFCLGVVNERPLEQLLYAAQKIEEPGLRCLD